MRRPECKAVPSPPLPLATRSAGSSAPPFPAHKKSRAAERQALTGRHKAERQALAVQVRMARRDWAEAISARYRAGTEELSRARAQALARLQESHGAALQHEDRQRQVREAGREQARSALQQRIVTWKQAGKAGAGRERVMDHGP